jgi:hypothetical protein
MASEFLNGSNRHIPIIQGFYLDHLSGFVCQNGYYPFFQILGPGGPASERSPMKNGTCPLYRADAALHFWIVEA